MNRIIHLRGMMVQRSIGVVVCISSRARIRAKYSASTLWSGHKHHLRMKNTFIPIRKWLFSSTHCRMSTDKVERSGAMKSNSQVNTHTSQKEIKPASLSSSERRDELARLHLKHVDNFSVDCAPTSPMSDSFRKLSYPDYTPGPNAQSICDVRNDFASRNSPGAGEHLDHYKIEITGRVTSIRKASRKLVFYDLSQEGTTLQVVASAARFASSNDSNQSNTFAYNVNMLRVGDIIAVEGHIGRTKLGELSIFANRLQLLSPCLHDIPDRLLDAGIQRSHRHLHMLVNKDFIQTLRMRTKVIQSIRDFFVSRRFLEVETPVLWPSAGGASARPFVTHAHGIDAELSLRIATELFLKTLVIGGIDRVFEIGKQFRNEGIDATHNPEFTTCEAYMAYGDFPTLCDMTEDLVRGVVVAATGNTVVRVPTTSETAIDGVALRDIDFSSSFQRVWVMDALEQALDRPLPSPVELSASGAVGEASLHTLKQLCDDVGVAVTPPVTAAALLDRLVSKFIEPTLVQPTFLCGHPVCMSPLAKQDPLRPGLASRLELFVNGAELANAYQELNDPDEQRMRFNQQLRDRAAGDIEAPFPDTAYCAALEYALPPTVGLGIGVDRLCMLVSGTSHLRDVLAFPVHRGQQRSE
eukprot:m.474082 g.474082  ORF g.474082 m.474082 type:complete len:639 (+) comp21670_c3_seq31:204-2120(+)